MYVSQCAQVAAVAEAVTLSPVVAAPADKTPEAAPESVATPVADAVTAEPKTIAEEPVVVPIEKPAEAAAVQSEITPIAAVPSDEASAEGAAADADFVDADNGDEAAEEDEGEGDDAANEEEAAEDEEEEVCVPDVRHNSAPYFLVFDSKFRDVIQESDLSS